jgi:hypothetical protein
MDLLRAGVELAQVVVEPEVAEAINQTASAPPGDEPGLPGDAVF